MARRRFCLILRMKFIVDIRVCFGLVNREKKFNSSNRMSGSVGAQACVAGLICNRQGMQAKMRDPPGLF